MGLVTSLVEHGEKKQVKLEVRAFVCCPFPGLNEEELFLKMKM